MVYFALFIYAQTILYPEQSFATHLKQVLPSAILTLLLNVLTSVIIGTLFLSRIDKWKIEVGHLQFVDNFKEGIIILQDDNEKIKLVNTAARKMLNLPVPEADSFEERMLADDFETGLLRQLKLGQIRLNDPRDYDLE